MKKIVIIFVFLLPAFLFSQQDLHPGIHGGAGTDINLGLAVGLKFSMIPLSWLGHPLEVGAEIFYSHSEETSDNGYDESDSRYNEYIETTDLIVVGLMANWLINYQLEGMGLFYVLGTGVAAISVEWVETSETDTSLGEPYGDSGSQQSVEGITGGTVLNLGIGYKLTKSFELRLELPVIVIFSSYGEASTVVPTLTLMAGYRF